MNPQQQQQLYAIFVGVFILNVAVTIWNVKEGRKLQKLQEEIAERQLKEVKRREKLNGNK